MQASNVIVELRVAEPPAIPADLLNLIHTYYKLCNACNRCRPSFYRPDSHQHRVTEEIKIAFSNLCRDNQQATLDLIERKLQQDTDCYLNKHEWSIAFLILCLPLQYYGTSYIENSDWQLGLYLALIPEAIGGLFNLFNTDSKWRACSELLHLLKTAKESAVANVGPQPRQ